MKWMRAISAALGVWLLFNMTAIPLWWGGVNAQGGVRGWIQVAILVGFAAMLLFDLGSGVFLFSRSCLYRGRQDGDMGRRPCPEGWLLVLALLAVMGLAGAKVMVDEIARETPMGAAGGEWAVLYVCLTLQLAYLLSLVFLPSQREGRP